MSADNLTAVRGTSRSKLVLIGGGLASIAVVRELRSPACWYALPGRGAIWNFLRNRAFASVFFYSASGLIYRPAWFPAHHKLPRSGTQSRGCWPRIGARTNKQMTSNFWANRTVPYDYAFAPH